MGQYIFILIISMIPIIELRGAIPIGVSMGLNPLIVYIVSVIGSTIVSLPLVLTFKFILNKLSEMRYFSNFANKLNSIIQKKIDKLKYANFFGIVLFVGVPLPTTGSWSASAISSLLNIRLKTAISGVFIGNLIAGIIMLLPSLSIA